MTNKLPRLLVLASTYPRWSNDTEPAFVHELSRRLTAQFDVTVLAPHAPESKEKEFLDGVRVVRFRYAPAALECLAYRGGILSNLRQRPWTWLLVAPFLVAMLVGCIRELRHSDYAAIHAHWIIPQGLVAVLSRLIAHRRIPVLCTSHGADLFGLRGKTGTLLKRFTLNRADRVSVVSNAMRPVVDELQSRAGAVHVLPMGVELQQRFTPDDSVVREPGLVLFVGRLVEKKGVGILINAFQKLRRDNPGLRMLIAGDGPDRRSLEEQVSGLGLREHVEFTGALRQDALPALMRRATFFVMPSIQAAGGDQEGLGLVQVEAMGCGCPVISSDLPAIRDVIVDRRTGLLVPPGNAIALCAAMQMLLADNGLRRRLAQHALAHVREHFDWESVANRYASLFESMLPHSPPSSRNSER